MSGGWQTSTRRQRLPANWESELRPAVLARDGGQCQWPVRGRACAAPANQVDHIDPSGPDEMDNLRALCQPHHAAKSGSEGGQASARLRRRIAAARFRPAEPHPGLLTQDPSGAARP